MKPHAIVTIVSNNYLHFARTLMQSVAEQHPEAERYCVIVDIDQGPGKELASEFSAIQLSELNLPFGEEFMFQYTILELNTAVKPWALQYLLEKGHDSVFYIDPDIFLYAPLTEVSDLLSDGANVVVTPHLLAPIGDSLRPGEVDIRMAGVYNLGFCAVGNTPSSRSFLSWWQTKLERDCVVDFAAGIFVDQSWIDLVPGLFDNIAILRHPGYNVAYWNLAQREISPAPDGKFLVNGQPLAFFHYSGLNPKNPLSISKHQNRLTLNSVNDSVRSLVLGYCEAVINNQQDKYSRLPYGYANFSDGTPIPAEIRRRFRLGRKTRPSAPARPFQEIGASTPEATAKVKQDEQPFQSTLEEVSRSTPDATAADERVAGIYNYFLDRAPEAEAMQRYRGRCNTLYGYLRLAYGVGQSRESRERSRWLLRLLLWPLWLTLQSLLARSDKAPHPKETENYPSLAAVERTPTLKRKFEGVDFNKYGINLIGYLAAELGVGEAARSLARACSAVGIPYSAVDVGYQSSNLQRDTQILDAAVKDHFPIDLVYVNADQTQATIKHLKGLGHKRGYRIGFWHWEQPQIPAAHLAAFAHLDEVWVPAEFVRDAVAAVSPLPVTVIPHALSFSATLGVQRSSFGLPENKVLALVMYDFHSYQYRKNPQAAIAAFRKATAHRSDAILVVKTINGDKHPDTAAELREYLADLPGAVMIDEFLTRQQTWDLQACCDMLISLHRAEGFGLAPAEMMYLGKPVVATGWSANMDFMTPNNSMPVRYKLKPLEEAVGAYPAGPVWAEADVDHAAACIAQLLDQPELRKRLGQQASVDIRSMLDPETVGKLVESRLRAILQWQSSELAHATHDHA